MSIRVAFAGGGTAGHLHPSLAVARALREIEPDAELLFLGAKRGVDAALLSEMGLPHVLLSARPFPYSISLALVTSAAALVAGTFQALVALRRFRPEVLFASGGYVAGPGVLAARLLGVPSVVHAGDALPDRTGRAVGRFARRITLAFEAAATYFPPGKTIFTGPPIRPEVLGCERADGLAHFGLSAERKVLLITGGSRGARAINNAVVEALPRLLERPDLQVVHLTGQLDYEDVRARATAAGATAPAYQCHAFCREMGLAYAACDLILCRAGSSSLGEALAVGKPIVAVPLPHAGGHQLANARPIAEAGAAVVIPNDGLSADRLIAELFPSLDDPVRLRAMAEVARTLGRPDAAATIARTVLAVARGLPVEGPVQ